MGSHEPHRANTQTRPHTTYLLSLTGPKKPAAATKICAANQDTLSKQI